MDAHGSNSLYTTDVSGPVAFVFGNEAHGLPQGVVSSADATVRVPHAGAAESLNLAAAATICLFEHARRRGEKGESLETLISAAAHDIRSPLTAMKGFGYALEKRWPDMTDEQRALMLTGIVHDADRMDQILHLLVDAARVSNGGPRALSGPCDIGELVTTIADCSDAIRNTPRSYGRAIRAVLPRPRAAEDRRPRVRRVVGVVGVRRPDHGRRDLARRRSSR
jgi:signal transduction histidine kinase